MHDAFQCKHGKGQSILWLWLDHDSIGATNEHVA